MYVSDNNVTIDGATVILEIASGLQAAMTAQSRLDLVNGAKLSMASDCYWLTLQFNADSVEGILFRAGAPWRCSA